MILSSFRLNRILGGTENIDDAEIIGIKKSICIALMFHTNIMRTIFE